jgi:hypothetical protein
VTRYGRRETSTGREPSAHLDIAAKYGVRVYEFIAVRSTPVHGVASTMALLDGVGRANVAGCSTTTSMSPTVRLTHWQGGRQQLLLVHISDVKDLPMRLRLDGQALVSAKELPLQRSILHLCTRSVTRDRSQ